MKHQDISNSPLAETASFPMPDAVVIYQTPDRRPLRQRLASWWQRCWRAHPAALPVRPTPEPEWKGHWAVTKYL